MSLRGYEHDTSAGTRDVIVTGTRRRTLGAWPAGAAFSGLLYCVPKDFVVLVAIVLRSWGLEGHVFRRLLLGHPLTQAWQRYRATRADAGRRLTRPVFALLIFVCALVLVDTTFFTALTPLLPYYTHVAHLSKSGAGALVAGYPLGSGALAQETSDWVPYSLLVAACLATLAVVRIGSGQRARPLLACLTDRKASTTVRSAGRFLPCLAQAGGHPSAASRRRRRVPQRGLSPGQAVKVGSHQYRAQSEAKAAPWLPRVSRGSASQRTRTWVADLPIRQL